MSGRSPARCGRCQEPIRFWLSNSWRSKKRDGRPDRVAIDFSPADNGIIRKTVVTLPDGSTEIWATELRGEAWIEAVAAGESLWTRHRDTCSGFRERNPKPPDLELDLPPKRKGYSYGPGHRYGSRGRRA